MSIRERLKTVVPGNVLVICPQCKGFGEASGDIKYTCDRCGHYPVTVKADCARCIGTGLAGPTDGECPACEGLGYFKVPEGK